MAGEQEYTSCSDEALKDDVCKSTLNEMQSSENDMKEVPRDSILENNTETTLEPTLVSSESPVERPNNSKNDTESFTTVSSSETYSLPFLFSSHPPVHHRLKDVKKDYLIGLFIDGESIATKTHEKQTATLCHPSLISQLCCKSFRDMLDRKEMRKRTRIIAVNTPSYSPAHEDKDDDALLPPPPTPSREDHQKSCKSLWQLDRQTTALLLYTQMVCEAWENVKAVKSYCFRILRCMNASIPSWGSHGNSFVWHSMRILNADTVKCLIGYILAFDEVTDNLCHLLRLHHEQHQHLSKQPFRLTPMGHFKRTKAIKQKASSYAGVLYKSSGPDCLFDCPLALSTRNQFEVFNSKEIEKKRDLSSLTKNDLIGNHSKEIITWKLLPCLMSQMDREVLRRCIIFLDSCRQRIDTSYTLFSVPDQASFDCIVMNSEKHPTSSLSRFSSFLSRRRTRKSASVQDGVSGTNVSVSPTHGKKTLPPPTLSSSEKPQENGHKDITVSQTC